MLGSWILLLLMLPGWLVPSGLRFSTCACAEQAAEMVSCCAEKAAPPCCATRSSADDSRSDSDAPRAHEDPACVCFVATPEHEGDRALLVDVYTSQLLDAARIESPIAWNPMLVVTTRIERHRPRGPSSGGSIPLPLRL